MPQLRLLPFVGEPLGCELADHLVHPEAVRAVGIRARAQQALVVQRFDLHEAGCEHILGVVDRAAGREQREPRKETAFVLVEQIVRPRDRRSERRMAGVSIAWAAEQIEAGAHAIEQGLWRQRLGARCGEFDREWDPVETLAELLDGRGALEAGANRAGASEEQRHCLFECQRQQVELLLRLDPERLSAGHE